jgi:hypothetical protein
MNPALVVLLGVVAAVPVYEGTIGVKETIERHHYYNIGRAYCDLVKKPFLAVGLQRWSYEPPNADVVADIDPQVLDYPGGVQTDERDMPFADKQFGAVYNAHTLEHMATPEDVELAMNECLRVADVGLFLCPSPYSLYANMFCPAHNLRLFFDSDNEKIVVRKNNWRTGIGKRDGGGYMAPAAVTDQAIIAWEPMNIPTIIIA